MAKLPKGVLQIYTGNGKGKTTAALGQAVRAAGFGLKTFILQFMKEFPYNELRALEKLKEWITIEQYGNDKFVYQKQLPSAGDIAAATQALERARQMMLSKEYDLVILDEVCVAIYFQLLTTEQLLKFVDEKPQDVELILTGRYCPQALIDRADLVTEMKEVKHYYQKGISARRGIES